MGEAKRKRALGVSPLSLSGEKLDETTNHDLFYPQQVLETFSRQWPGLWKVCESARLNPDNWFVSSCVWESWCFMPINAITAFMQYTAQDRYSPEVLETCLIAETRLAASLAAWRLTKGIYRFDQTVAESIMKTDLQDDINTEVLFRLPEWCIYIPTPGLTYMNHPMHGFFASIDDHFTDTVHFDPELNLVMMVDMLDETSQLKELKEAMAASIGYEIAWKYVPIQQVLTLRTGTGISEVVEMIARKIADTSINVDAKIRELVEKKEGQATFDQVKEGVVSQVMEAQQSTIKKMLSLLLYICSQNADITPYGNHSHGLAEVKKTKRGKRIFESDRVNAWDVGLRVGAEIRRYSHDDNAEHGDGTGASIRPHIRRAHWHSYWKGPKDDPEARQIDIRWLPPILVNVESADDTIITARNIK